MKFSIDYHYTHFRQNIFIWALGVAVVLNLDKLILTQWAPTRIVDSFDGPFQSFYIFAKNILRYGFFSQTPYHLCGVSALTFSTPPLFLALMMFLPLYPCYIILSLLSVFVAFSGMFLLLHDDLKLNQSASIVSGLFFCSLDLHVAAGIGIFGLPLLVWCFERIFEINNPFKKKLVSYLYIVLYFSASMLPIFYLPAFIFFVLYFLFLSNIKRTTRNIVTIILIWCLFLLINLPTIVELINCIPTSHRVLFVNPDTSWCHGIIYFVKNLFNIDFHSSFMSTPSLLGIFIILFYFSSIKEAYNNKLFYFSISTVLAIECYVFFLSNTPFLKTLSSYVDVYNNFRSQRVALLLPILFSMLIGQASHYLVVYDLFSCKGAWFLTISSFCLYVVFGNYFRLFHLTSFILQAFNLAVLIVLVSFKYIFNKKYSLDKILIVSFLIFSFTTAIHDRTYWGPYSFRRITTSPHIELIKYLERNNLDQFRVASHDGAGLTQLLLNGFKCADGYVNVYPASYKEFWIKVIEPEINKSGVYKNYFLGFGGRVTLVDDSALRPLRELSFNLDLLRLINVKYLFFSMSILNCEKYGLIEIAEGSETLVNGPDWKLNKYLRPWEYYIYQNKNYCTPAFLTGKVRFFEKKDMLLNELGTHNFKYLSTHTFALTGVSNILKNTKLNLKESEIINIQLKPDEMTVWLRNRYPVILNWTTNYNPNWICEIDGRKVDIFIIYNTFMGVLVPPNSHIIKFKYQNILLWYAYWVCFVGFVIINAYVVISLKRFGA